MNNVPVVKLGIVAVSRNCFPIELSTRRREAIVDVLKNKGVEIYDCPITAESETDMLKAVADVKANGVNALVVFLGNFGPETTETLMAREFGGPVMYAGAAEENTAGLSVQRGDAYCGMLNLSYNLALRNIKAYIPSYPVGNAEEVADMIVGFVPFARTLLGLKKLKIMTFGPRPEDFLACNAPIKQLHNLGVEVQENSELDLFASFEAHKNDKRIPEVVADMQKESGAGAAMADILPRLAQYELTLTDWIDNNRGSREFVVMANKCWPAFQEAYRCVPCYVNGRLTARGIPVSCEVDIYGALSEYIGTCVSMDAVTLLDINNSVPYDMYDADIKGKFDYRRNEVFMGFHCGNTSASKMVQPEMKYQKIMHDGLEKGEKPDITRGTLEGDLVPGAVTVYRVQSTADAKLVGYVAQGEVLPVKTRSFGSIGVIAISEMERFYRYALIDGNYPHHAAVAFGSYGKTIYDVLQYLGVENIEFNRPRGNLYKGENPFAY